MSQSYDTLIVGGGLAGACAALHLSRTRRVLLLEADQPASQASGAAAGLVNPLMGRRPRLAWRLPEALDALHATLKATNAMTLFRGGGVLRPAVSDEHARHFKEAAADHPGEANWLDAATVKERYPSVYAEGGALFVKSGGAVNVPRMVNVLLEAARNHGADVRVGTRVTGWREDEDAAYVEAEQAGQPVHFSAQRMLLALGADYAQHDELNALALQSIKGQTVRAKRPPQLNQLPFLSGSGYVVPEQDALIVGSSYEHDYVDLTPSSEQTKKIIEKAARMLPLLKEAPVLEERAGARVKVLNSRYPMLGPLPGRRNVWVFTGLGSKGLLMGPLLARELPDYLDNPDSLPNEVRVQSK